MGLCTKYKIQDSSDLKSECPYSTSLRYTKKDVYTKYRDKMFEKTHTDENPWIIIQADKKKKARLGAIRYVLNQLNYSEKDTSLAFQPDSKVVSAYQQ